MSNNNKSMNKDLQEWLSEKKDELEVSKEKNKKAGKKPSGNCEICGKKKATSICIKCGKSVCKSCYFKIIGVCKKCVPKDIARKWDGSHPDWEKELGVEWVG